MRRKQTALVLSFLILSSLAFISQTRPQSPVSSTDPNLAEGTESPVTDQDGDMIPDLYEVIFSSNIEINTESFEMTIEGLKPSDSTDNASDNDRDGLSALQEYCWPYTLEHCFEERNSLTGKPPEETESGLREYLDPRVSDTDGDGLPDGYEVYMCTVGGMYWNNPADPLSKKKTWECQYFDPLDPRDYYQDFDRCESDFSWGCGDGFDFNSDGLIDAGEKFTNAEEYQFGIPENWITERDGLWCAGSIVGILDGACQTDFVRSAGTSGWLGTDPRFSDSDFYFWDELVESELEFIGDGIPDGWEAHHGLNPLNSSDAILDSDLDGWDLNKDGFVSPDVDISTAHWGESLSNFEEYIIDLDEGYGVLPGLSGTRITSTTGQTISFDHSSATRLVDSSIHSLITDQPRERLLVGSKYGITALDPFRGTSSQFHLSNGIEAQTMVRHAAGESDLLMVGSNVGLHIIAMKNGLPEMGTMITHEIGKVSVITPLFTQSDDLELLILGDERAWKSKIVIGFDSDSSTTFPEQIESLSKLLSDSNASVTASSHIKMPGRSPMLLVGTDSGLIAWNTTNGDDSIGQPWWIFNRLNAESFVNVNLMNSIDSARVNTIVSETNDQGYSDVWIGTSGGLHLVRLNLIISQPTKSFYNERMLNLDGLLNGANDVHSILPMDGMVAVGSKFGTWCLEGGSSGILGMYLNQTEIFGLVTSMTTLEKEGEGWIFFGISPGQFMNIAPMNPNSMDSDLDGMPDGWEFANGLDPTDPFDSDRDLDSDGVSISWDQETEFNRHWSNLQEYRFISSVAGFNGTDPRDSDSDGDGLTDGEEYWGWFLEPTSFDCHYLNAEYICNQETGQNARDVHLGGWLGTGSGGGSDLPTDPTNPDSDGDGMPDGWEIKNRRWIGDVYTGGNNWTLDPRDPSDAMKDADGDGLLNLCEYEWEKIRSTAIELGLENHGESSESAMNWIPTDPNSVDSDQDSLPDGWEARYSCHWHPDNSGINPMNGSDFLNNPDGDGFDANNNGILELSESLVNWFEYHLKSEIFQWNITDSGMEFPENFTSILNHESWIGLAEGSFGEFAGSYYQSISSEMPVQDIGSSDPLDSDSDSDGMPDGWEFYHARWSLFQQDWTLNPVNDEDGLGDPDLDGMNNWEEYNSINSTMSETDSTISVPQFYLSDASGAWAKSPWLGAESLLSFGSFVSDQARREIGLTTDPNNPDSDDDGILDGVELVFTTWNSSDEVWTLNPLVKDDGDYDSDGDGITDLTELNLTSNNPINGGLSPPEAPFFWEESSLIDYSEFEDRIYRIIFSKAGRAELAMNQFLDWKEGGPAKPMLASILGITDPTERDTDRDGMSDGYEYWFTKWNLEGNHWEMNPLTDSDVSFDSDQDSFDCNGDGEISDSESFDNLAEYDSKWFGKRTSIDSFPNGTGVVSYGEDAINALIEESGISESQARDKLFTTFAKKSPSSNEKVGLINGFDPDNFNKTLLGISDPNDDDSDRDGMPDGWEFCFSIYLEVLPVNSLRWSLNPLNFLDRDYDPDRDGWNDRSISDSPATHGYWEDREFFSYSEDSQFSEGATPLLFTNFMEFNNGTGPLEPDSDGDSIMMIPIFENNNLVDYVQDLSLSDGREIFKYGTNPLDNDTDGDMLPDFYEYSRGWNETNDNWSSFLQIEVQWQEVTPNNWKPVDISKGFIARPSLNWTWFTHDPTNPNDVIEDPDKDGDWDCDGSSCEYIPYNNFQEFYAVVNTTLSSPTIVRSSSLFDCSGEEVNEWWQLRETLLGTCSGSNSISSNYLRVNRINDDDQLYALIIDDNDLEYDNVNSSDDIVYVNGAWTDSYNRLAGDRFHLPNIGLGEFPYSWWILDIDGDFVADGTDPANWDTDGDWLNDFFEIHDDLLDGIRGNSGSPIRYDDRTT